MIPASLVALVALTLWGRSPPLASALSAQQQQRQPPPSPSSPPPSFRGPTAERYGDLLAWMESFSGAIVNPSVEIRPSPIGGFGAFAGAPLAEGEVLFSIPRSACVTVSDAVEDTECGEPINNLLKKAGPGGTTVALAGYLAKEYLKLRAIELGTRRTAEAEAGTETDVSGPLGAVR